MLITKTVKIKWNYRYKTYYEFKGYTYTKMGEEFEVKVEDLQKGSGVEVKVLCDYCKINIILKKYYTYIRDNEKGIIHKDCCTDCSPLKLKESNLLKYNVENTSQLPEVKEKVKKTNNDKFGYDYPFNNPEVIQKIKNTNINKYGTEYYLQSDIGKEIFKETFLKEYGVDNPNKSQEVRKRTEKTNILKFGFKNPLQNEEIKKKKDDTVKIKYGVDNISQSEEIKNKKKETCMNNFGVEYPTQNKEIVNKIMENKAKTLYKNGTAPCSSQQLYINNILKGILNYPIDHYNLDILLLDDNVYVECDFSGHDLNLKIGQISQKDFDKKEKYRYYYLKNRGYKMIKIISVRDYIPIDDDIIHKIITYAKEWFDKDHSWIKFDIDNNNVITSQGINKYNFGELKRITCENYNKIISNT